MQLINSRTDIKTNVEKSSRVEFGISKDSAKLFSMLSSSLYSNKEQAVLYEIGANCNDAHILAGTPERPWDLTMPTNLDAHIRFRDYGPGLSEENVYRLLTTYGESTKSDSNVFIGAFGLGSKSPAAVTSTWNIVSRFEGELKEYFIVIDASGIPSLTKIRTEKTDHESGLEVIIPVNPNRIWNWTENLTTVFKYYAVKPNIKNSRVTWSADNPGIQRGTGWKLITAERYSGRTIKFITTQREYSVDTQLLKNELQNMPLLKLLGMAFIVEFPTGELETSLSREQIQYTRHTLDAIKARLNMVHDEFAKILTNYLAPATDGLHYRQLVVAACKDVFGVVGDSQVIIPFLVGNKYGVSSPNDLQNFVVKVKDVHTVDGRICNGKTISAFKKNHSCWKSYAIQLHTEYNTSGGGVSFKINSLDRVTIVIDDTKGTPSRVKHKLGQGQGKYALIVKHNFFPAELQRFVVKASTLEQPPKAPRVKGTKAAPVVWGIWRKSFQRLDESKIDKKTKVVAIEFADARTIDSIPKMQRKMVDIIKSNSKDITIIAVKEGQKIPKYAVPIEDFILDEFARLNTVEFVDSKMYADLQNSLIGYNYGYSNNVFHVMNKVKFRTAGPSLWNEVMDTIAQIMAKKVGGKAADVLGEYSYLSEISSLLDIPLQSSKGTVISLDKIRDNLYNTYKMLKYVDSGTEKKDITEYIELVGI
jgi:hypothetical protein